MDKIITEVELVGDTVMNLCSFRRAWSRVNVNAKNFFYRAAHIRSTLRFGVSQCWIWEIFVLGQMLGYMGTVRWTELGSPRMGFEGRSLRSWSIMTSVKHYFVHTLQLYVLGKLGGCTCELIFWSSVGVSHVSWRGVKPQPPTDQPWCQSVSHTLVSAIRGKAENSSLTHSFTHLPIGVGGWGACRC